MSYGYGGRPNPYDQRGGAANPPYPTGPEQPSYGAPPASYGRQQQYNNVPAMGRDDYAGQNVEMAPLAQNGQEFGRQNDPNAILNKCSKINNIIENAVAKFKTFEHLQVQYFNEVDPLKQQSIAKQIDTLSTNIMSMYRDSANDLKWVKQQPESGSPKNAPQVGKVERRLKAAVNQFQNVEAGFKRRLKVEFARQYKIVRPDASDAEVQQAVEDPSLQLFSQTLLQSDRRGQSQSIMRVVESRHETIQKIEEQLVELAQLFQDMDNLVVQQEAAVINIEMKGEEVVEHMDKGTEQIGVAIKSARNARKWKWWCLGICILIVIIIVVVVLIFKFVIQNNGTTKAKRFVLPDLSNDRVISDQLWTPSEKLVVPGLEWKGDGSNRLVAKPVVPGKDWPGDAKPVVVRQD